MQKKIQESLAELFAIRAVMSLICEQCPNVEKPIPGVGRRIDKETKTSTPYFSSWQCFWGRMWSNFTNPYLISFLSGLSSALCTVLDLLFPILQISAVFLLAVFGAVGMLNSLGLPMKLLCVFLVFIPLLLRIILCIAVSIRETKKNKPAFSASQVRLKRAQALLKDALEVYPCLAFDDWGKTDLLIHLLEREGAADIAEALRTADLRIEREGEKVLALASEDVGNMTESSLAECGALEDALARLCNGTERGALRSALSKEISVPSQALAEHIRRTLCGEPRSIPDV